MGRGWRPLVLLRALAAAVGVGSADSRARMSTSRGGERDENVNVTSICLALEGEKYAVCKLARGKVTSLTRLATVANDGSECCDRKCMHESNSESREQQSSQEHSSQESSKARRNIQVKRAAKHPGRDSHVLSRGVS